MTSQALHTKAAHYRTAQQSNCGCALAEYCQRPTRGLLVIRHSRSPKNDTSGILQSVYGRVASRSTSRRASQLLKGECVSAPYGKSVSACSGSYIWRVIQQLVQDVTHQAAQDCTSRRMINIESSHQVSPSSGCAFDGPASYVACVSGGCPIHFYKRG